MSRSVNFHFDNVKVFIYNANQRKKTLLVEYEQKNHSGGIVDRRFGENDPTMPPEERMLERFTKERQRASKGVAFNLEDEDELTHYGKSLSALDDFDNAGLNIDENDEDAGFFFFFNSICNILSTFFQVKLTARLLRELILGDLRRIVTMKR